MLQSCGIVRFVITAILLDDARWAEVPDARRQEWRLAIRELLDEHLFRIEESPLVMRVSWNDAAITMRWEALEKGAIAEAVIDRATLDAQTREYLEICRKLSALEGQSARIGDVAALDQAKRDAHDLAAKELLRVLDAVGPTHDTARRIFTLLVVLLTDTTTLSALQRPHGTNVVARYV